MAIKADLDALHEALQKVPGFSELERGCLEPMRFKGLVHDHVALNGHRVNGERILARVPKLSQFALAAGENLRYQAACFARVSATGHGPRLHALIEPDENLPMGALLVDHIEGRPPRLPEELEALARAMAKVHSLPMPEARSRVPLEDHRDPVAGILEVVEEQVPYLDEAELEPAARAEIEDELAWARAFAAEAEGRPQPITLVLTDTHPGNFLIEPSGKAVIVDLEKALYGSPAIDLAHASIYSSTTWDPDTWSDLSVDDVAAFYRCYLEMAAPELAAGLRPWLVPLRRFLFLRAITWCVKWSVLHNRHRRADKHLADDTEDWSAELSDPVLIAHVEDRVSHYLSTDALRRMRAEWLGPRPLDSLI